MLRVRPVETFSVARAQNNKLLAALRSRALACVLAPLSLLASCTVELNLPCSDDPKPRDYCADLHAEFELEPKDWVCVDKSCNYPLDSPDGCFRISTIVQEQLALDDPCFKDDPSVSEDPAIADLVQTQLGIMGATSVPLPGGQIVPNNNEAAILDFSAPPQLRLGQAFVARLSTNYLNPAGVRTALLHMLNATEGLIVDGVLSTSGQSRLGRYTIDIIGRIGPDERLVGGPHVLQIALLDPAGNIGPLFRWEVEIIGGPPVGCPLAADCNARSCGLDPVCGNSCGTCQASEACHFTGICEPLHADACPEAADCSQRSCGPDPVCGIECGPGCDPGWQCDVTGSCVPDPDDQTPCQPNCSGRVCGPDPVCGMTCGTCGDGVECTEAGKCDVCQPDCEGRACGFDPVCNLLCGVCEDGETCVDHTCE